MSFLDTVKERLSKLEKKHYYMIGGAVVVVIIIIVVLTMLSGLPAERFGGYSHYGEIAGFTFNRDGSRVASSDLSSWGKVMVWNVSERTRVAETAADSVRAEMMAFSADGSKLITVGYDEQVRYWEAGTGTELPKSTVALSAVSALSRDGRWLIYSKAPKTFVWDSTNPGDAHEFDGAAFRAQAMAFSPDSKLFAMGDKAGLLYVYETEAKDRRTPKQAHETTISGVAFSADGKVIGTASHDRTARLWDLELKELSVLKGHDDTVEAVAVGPGGKVVLTGSRDGTARLWNGETGKELFGKFETYEGRPESRVALSDDGSLAVIETDGSGIEVYDTGTGSLLYKIDAPVTAFAFPPGKNILFLGGTNGKVYTWEK